MNEPLARYPVRTPGSYWLVLVALCVICVVPLGLVWPLEARFHRIGGAGWLWLVAIGMAAVPVIYWLSTAAYRVGGRAEIRLFADRVELPRGDAGHDPFPLSNTVVTTRRMVVRYTIFGVPAGDVNRGVIATFTGARRKRELSDRVFEDPRHMQALLEDLELTRRGERPAGPRVPVPPAPPPLTPSAAEAKYRKQLEDELDDVD